VRTHCPRTCGKCGIVSTTVPTRALTTVPPQALSKWENLRVRNRENSAVHDWCGLKEKGIRAYGVAICPREHKACTSSSSSCLLNDLHQDNDNILMNFHKGNHNRDRVGSCAVQCCKFPKDWEDGEIKRTLDMFVDDVRSLVEMLAKLGEGFKDQAAAFIKKPTRDGKPLDSSDSKEKRLKEEAQKLARDYNAFQQSKFQAERRCTKERLQDMMATLKANMKTMAANYGFSKFCRWYVIPIHDFILKLGGKDELPTECMSATWSPTESVKPPKAMADVDLADELSVDSKTRARHGWAKDVPKTPTPTESPQVHHASSISGMCEF